ncbi:MAG: T9SS type A sorting domain-containing protein, partial [Bacteroidia bacterium]
DVNGNSATGNATVTVVDNTAPSVQAQNVTIYLDANGAASTTVAAVNNGSSDNCGIASMSISKKDFDCSNVGNNTVTLTVTDVNGNSANSNATVTVVDNTAPTVQTQNVTIYLDANGAASTTAGAIDNGSYDNCSIGSVSLSKTSFTCSNVGPNTVTLTVTDVNGNSATGNATVTVVDNIAPTVVTKSASVTLSGATASITASDVNNGSYDNCGVASVSVSPSTFNCSNIGANTVTLTVTDVNGNTSTNTATVTVNGYIPSCTLSATPSNNTYTGAATNQMFIGYGPQSMNLSCSASGGTGFSYSWSGSYLSSTSGSTNVFSPTAGGNYTLVCTVTNSNGCETTCSITICVLDIRSNNNANNQKVYLCHVPNGNSNNAQTLSISVSAVPSHLNNHSGDKLGQCSQTCGSLKNEPVGELYEVGEEVHLIIYPNPSSSVFKITLESESDQLITVTLFDATGKLIKQIEGGHSFEEMHLDASGLAPGVYMAVVKQGDLVKTVKLTKTE